MVGLFAEIGPCDASGNETRTNPHSWANFANLLVLDQPAGVGFSTAESGFMPDNLDEASRDFQVFLAEFASRFPEYLSRGLYIAGESFAGQYVPVYVADILRKQLSGAPEALGVEIPGVVLVDALVDGAYVTLGFYEMFCTDRADVLRFNETACEEVAAAMPEMEKLARWCQATGDAYACATAQGFGSANIFKFLQEEVDARRRSPYDSEPCPSGRRRR